VLTRATTHSPGRCGACEKEKNEMFANKEIESQTHKANSANAHIAFLPTQRPKI
jgi:hypothetical protein